MTESCNEAGSCSYIDGFTVDVARELAKMYNFTWTYRKFPTDDWGTTPISGEMSDPNATFDGIFGRSLLTFKFLYLMVTCLW